MDDINFDELDQAVNSALKQAAPKDAPQTDIPAAEPAVLPVDDVPPQAAPSVVVPKRRGQFMDMVHPSSDMIKPTTPRPNRQAVTIEPLSPEIVETPEDTPEQSNVPEQTFTTEGSIAPIESHDIPAPSEVEAVAPKPEWPDPLDVMEQTKQERDDLLEEASVDEHETAADVSEHDDSEVASEEPVQDEPGATPFLTGTSPEKRPLGAFAETPNLSDETKEVDMDTPEPSTDVDVPEQSQHDFELEPLPSVPVPQELAPEVVSVESDEPPHHAEETPAPSEAGPMTTSIPQQYKNADVPPEDQADHPVFDTRDYHQPLTPPARQGHTGAIITIVLILLALLGVGAWYAIAVLKLI